MLNWLMRTWFSSVEWGRVAIQTLGGGNGDPEALRTLDQANKKAWPASTRRRRQQ
ncbi:hypothetical protein [Orlajensenia leifsoniae]|uniref:hypothetical protein n=1 Tax=Orlajensenia leifsoniae TaxID=2561933 RepID=UPI00143103DA|nr:hypothetical protein [Leifsonia flava]